MLFPQMTSKDVKEGVDLTIKVAHELKAALGRRPSLMEIQWRTAAAFQKRFPSFSVRATMEMAARMIDVIQTTSTQEEVTSGNETTTTKEK